MRNAFYDALVRLALADPKILLLTGDHGYALFDHTAGECMTTSPVTIGRKALATQALDLMESRKITAVVIVDAAGGVEGVVHLHDLWKTEMI